MKIHHVAGFVVGHGDVGALFLRKLYMIEGVFGGEVGGGEVVVAVGDQHFHGGVQLEAFAEGLCDVDIMVLECVVNVPIQ